MVKGNNWAFTLSLVLLISSPLLLSGCFNITFTEQKSPETLCGNGIINPGEDCDDGNIVDGDNCPATCNYMGEKQQGTIHDLTIPAGNGFEIIRGDVTYYKLPGNYNAGRILVTCPEESDLVINVSVDNYIDTMTEYTYHDINGKELPEGTKCNEPQGRYYLVVKNISLRGTGRWGGAVVVVKTSNTSLWSQCFGLRPLCARVTTTK